MPENQNTPNDHFADLHCHPHSRSFNTFRNSDIEKEPSRYHPWHLIWGNKKKADKGKRATPYSQSDLAKLTNGKANLAFTAMYPMERGWFINSDMPFSQAWQLVTKRKENRDSFWAALGALTRFNSSKVSMVQRLAMPNFLKIPCRRIRFFRKPGYDYFAELLKERDFLLTKNGIETQSTLYPQRKAKHLPDTPENNRFYKAKGMYVFARNGSEIEGLLADGRTVMVMTFEGGNMLNAHLPIDIVRQNIATVKSWADTPVFFISLAHHFYNDLCGHAHSIPNNAAFFINQTQGMHNGITPKGLAVVQELLAIDAHGNHDPSKGRRILIDVKHMNVVSRQDYYDIVVLPSLETGNPIPVIASHVCYSGVPTLHDLCENMHYEGKEEEGAGFLNWNINLCDEEIRTIFASDGIIGINLDQRVLGVPQKSNNKHDHFSFIWANIKAMADVVLSSNPYEIWDKDESTVWDLFCIGSDFDGYIDPANGYSTSLDFGKFEANLAAELAKPGNGKYLLNGNTPASIARKVVFDNAKNFAVKHFV